LDILYTFIHQYKVTCSTVFIPRVPI